MQYTGTAGDSLYDVGSKVRAYGEGNAAGYEPQTDQHGIVVNSLAAGARMLAPSLAPAAAVAGGLALAPVSIPTAVGIGAGALATGALFGASQGQETFEKGVKAGLPIEQVKEAGRINALIEGVGETAGTWVGGKFVTGAGRAIGKALGRTEGQAVLDAAKDTRVLKPFLKAIPGVAATEVGTEVGQNAGEAAIERAYGIDTKTPTQAGVEAIGPTLGLTALLLPFGLAGHGVRARVNQNRMASLADTSKPDELRAKLSEQIASELERADPGAAAVWRENAGQRLAAKQPIALDDQMLEAFQKVPLPALPSPDSLTTSGGEMVVGPDGTVRPMTFREQQERAAQARMTPADQRAPTAEPAADVAPQGLPSPDEPMPGAPFVVGPDGAAAPMTYRQYQAQESARQSGKDTGLTPDVLRAQQPHPADVAAVEAAIQPDAGPLATVAGVAALSGAAEQSRRQIAQQDQAATAEQDQKTQQAAQESLQQANADSEAALRGQILQSVLSNKADLEPTKTFADRIGGESTKEELSVIQHEIRVRDQKQKEADKIAQRRALESAAAQATRDRPTAPAAQPAPTPAPAQSPAPSSLAPAQAESLSPAAPALPAQSGESAATSSPSAAPSAPSPRTESPSSDTESHATAARSGAPQETLNVPAPAGQLSPQGPSSGAGEWTTGNTQADAAVAGAVRGTPGSGIEAGSGASVRAAETATSATGSPAALNDPLRAAHEAIIRGKAQTNNMQRRIVDAAATTAAKVRAGEVELTPKLAQSLRTQADTISRWDSKTGDAVRVLADHVEANRQKSAMETARVERVAKEAADTAKQAIATLDAHFAGDHAVPVQVVYSQAGTPLSWSTSLKAARAWADRKSYGIAAGATIKRVAKADWKPIDHAAHQAATSPKNALPQPTPAQRDAGNFQMGHMNIAGLDVTIEHPAGSSRKPGWQKLAAHYGYVKRSTGADGENFDVFVRPGTPADFSGPVVVVDQLAKNGKFDEHKGLIGWPNKMAALQGYSQNYPRGFRVGPITQMSMEAFKTWLATGDTSQPLAQQAPPKTVLKSPATVPTVQPKNVALAKPATPAAPKATPNTEDAGAELAYNRRNRISTGIKWSDIADKNLTLQVKETTKQNVVPRPDYQALIDGGMQPIVAHVVKQAYDSLAPAPAINVAPTPEHLQRYIRAIHQYMDGVMAWANNPAQVKSWTTAISTRANAMLQARGRGGVDLSSLTGPQEKSLLDAVYPNGWRENSDDLRIIGGNKALKGLQPGTDDAIKATKAIEGGWPTPQEAWQKSYIIDEKDGRFHVMQKAAKWRLANGQPAGGFDSRDAAIEFARTLTKRENKTTVSDKGISVEKAEREGVPRRMEGEDVSSDHLKDSFGFKGVNFGNWMKGDSNQAERQLHLNHAYDAFSDLAELLEVPPKAVSLNGMLGVAIGAQGSGGHAAAHFVPGVNEINLTRTSGAGSLAHEWGHALDHYFATQAGMASRTHPFLTEHMAMKAPDGIRSQVYEAFRSIVKSMNKTTETPAQLQARQDASKARAQRNVDGWLKSIRHDFAARGVDEAAFDALAARIQRGDLGDGTIVAGSTALSPAVDQLRDLYKAKTGRLYPLDQIKSLQSNVDHLTYLTSERAADKAHVPQEITTQYAANAAKIDKEKGGKPYWSTNLEKFARAFDAFVSDKLEANAAKNTYLSHAGRTGETVPEGAERVAINKAFDTLVATVETKETGKGTALYNVTPWAMLGRSPPAAFDQQLYQLIERGTDASTLAKTIILHSKSPLNKAVARLLMKRGINPTFRTGTAEGAGLQTRDADQFYTAAFIPGKNAVVMFSATQTEHDIIHELAHAGTHAALRKPSIASAQMRLLYDHVRKFGTFDENAYGLETLDEFVAEAFSNPDFQAELRAIPAQRGVLGSTWDWFVKTVRSILGLGPESHNALSQALEIGSRLIEAEPTAGVAAANRGAPLASVASTVDRIKAQSKTVVPDFAKGYTDAQKETLRKVGLIHEEKTLAGRAAELMKTFRKTFVQGVMDQYAPLRELGEDVYIKARMSTTADGALEAALMHGVPVLDADGAVDVKINQGGGFLDAMKKLNGEHDRFFSWVAGNRAARLKREGRENLLTDSDISFLKDLNAGPMADGKSRAMVYAEALGSLRKFNSAVLDVAEKSGLFDAESRAIWESEFYVPFYRQLQQGLSGPSKKSGLVNQQTIKSLKGGTDSLNDLFANTLMNWSTLLSASAKNRAASAALQAAEKAGVAIESDPEAIRQMSKAIGTKAVSFLDEGRRRWYTVGDPHIMDAIASLEWGGFGPMMKPFRAFKRALSFGVTISPTYKAANLMRDTITAIGSTPIGYNPMKNVMQGWQATNKDSQTYASMLAGGGMMRFGTTIEDDRAQHVKNLVRAGVEDSRILNTNEKVAALATKVWDAYKEFGDRSENINRAALYEQLKAKGKTHLEASYMARDMMDFSLQGKWAAVRFLTQSVPFMNARLQGLYKLGRASTEDRARFAAVTGAVSLLSLGLMWMQGDDDDWKKREDWDRNNYWWIKIGGHAFYIPKPFEIGAVGTMAERSWELMFDEEMQANNYWNNVGALVVNNFSMSPIPQLLKPMMDVYSNKEGFTGRPIESLGLEHLKPEDRAALGTSESAKLLGQLGIPEIGQILQGQYKALSPVQWDALMRGYFGSLAVGTNFVLDAIMKPLLGRAETPDRALGQLPIVGRFVKELPSDSSRYVSQFYDEAVKIEQSYASYRDSLLRGDTDRAERLAESDADNIGKYHSVEGIKRHISALNRELKSIEESRELSGAEKRRLVASIRDSQDQMARQFTSVVGR